MSKLASKEAEVLKLVQDREVSGTRVKYIWVFTAGSRVVTREVHALEYKGLVKISYYAVAGLLPLVSSAAQLQREKGPP